MVVRRGAIGSCGPPAAAADRLLHTSLSAATYNLGGIFTGVEGSA